MRNINSNDTIGKRKYWYLILPILFLLNCTNDDTDGTGQDGGIAVETVTFSLLPEGGVKLSGILKNVPSEISYGFIVSKTPELEFSSSEIKTQQTGSSNGAFDDEVTSDLEKDVRYYFRAYAYIGNTFFYGEEKTFVANGNPSPIITQAIPDKGHILDTIGLKGKFFSKNPKIYFNEKSAIVLSSSDSLVNCVVPGNFPLGEIFENIRIVNGTGEESLFNGFSFHTPVIDSISPRIAYESDTLTFYGNHFDFENNRNTLAIQNGNQNLKMTVLESSRTQMVVKNDYGFFDKNPSFLLFSQLQQITSENQLTVLKPKITEVPNCLTVEEDLVVYGENFPRLAGEILIDNESFDIKFSYRDSLIINTKTGKITDFEFSNITFSYLGENIVYEENLCIGDAWLNIGSNNPIHTTTIQGEVYGTIYPTYSENFVGKFSTETNTFERISQNEIPPTFIGSRKVFNGNKIYAYLDNSYSNQATFLSYDIFTEQVKILNMFPGEARGSGLIAAVGDNIFMGLGSDVTGRIMKDIWKYSIIDNTWEKVIDFNEATIEENAKETPLVFVSGNTIYFGIGQRTGYYDDFWAFDTVANTIVAKTSLPRAIAGSKRVTILNNKAYFVDFYVYEYDIANDTWKIYNDLLFPDTSDRGPGSIFNIDGIIYRSIFSAYINNGRLYKLNPNLIQ